MAATRIRREIVQQPSLGGMADAAETPQPAPPPQPAKQPPPASETAAAVAAAGFSGDGSLADYVIEKAIGRGHFSTVHRAVRRSDERRVALKKVQIFDMLDAKARDRCLKEVQLLKSLPPHPSIIQYLDSFIDNNELYIVFQWAEHGDLRRLLRRASESKTSLQEVQVWRYFVQIADGIRHMHEARIMHRDIKPANIFLASNGSVLLGDLGLGRAFSSQTYEALSKVGTPLYMSPEVLDGRGYEWKSDVWSLGCLLYELATLRSPFKAEGDNLYTLFKKISVGKFDDLPSHYSPQLHKLTASMIQIDPKARPDIHTTVKFAQKALATFAEGGDNSDKRPPSAVRDGGNGGHGQGQQQGGRRSTHGGPPPPQQQGGGGGGGGGARDGAASAAAAISDCLVVMEAVTDKLKLLSYEKALVRARGLSPLPAAYFTGAAVGTVEGEQLEYLYALVCWLLDISVLPRHELWALLPRARSPTHDADANAACAALLAALRSAPPPLSSFGAMPAHRLRGARGAEVCAMLNALTDAALQQRGFEWAAPVHMISQRDEYDEDDEGGEGPAEDVTAVDIGGGAEAGGGGGGGAALRRLPSATGAAPPTAAAADDEPLESGSDDGGGGGGGGGGSNDDRDAVYVGDSGDDDAAGGGASTRDNSTQARRQRARERRAILWPSVDPALWEEECQRVAPALVLKVTWDQLSWRHRVDVAAAHAPKFAEHAPRVEQPLEAFSSSSQTSLETIEPLRKQHAEKQKALEAATEAFAAAQAKQQARSNELVELDESIRRAKEGAGMRGEELSGQAPLDRIRGALKALKAELKALNVREAMLHRVLESKRAASELRKADDAKRAGAGAPGAAGSAELPDLTEETAANSGSGGEDGPAYPREWQ